MQEFHLRHISQPIDNADMLHIVIVGCTMSLFAFIVICLYYPDVPHKAVDDDDMYVYMNDDNISTYNTAYARVKYNRYRIESTDQYSSALQVDTV